MDAAKLAALKQYMRVDGTEDDGLICELHEAALQYLAGAGIVFNSENALHRLAVSALTLSFFDNRDVELVGAAATPLDFGLRKLINQLKRAGGAAK